FDPEKQELLSCGKLGQLNRHYAKFTYARRQGKFQKDITFEDWIKHRISSKLRKQLEQLTEKYLTKEEYTLEQGVEFYIEHLKAHKERSKSIFAFYERFDTEKQKLLPSGKIGKLYVNYEKFNYSRKKGKLPQDLTFEHWIKQQIPSKLRKQLEQLTEKYLREYSLEQGVELYIEHLKEYKEDNKPTISFFIMFDIENEVMLSYGKRGQLSKHYRQFYRLKRKNQLPKTFSFTDYILQNLPEEKRERAEYYLKGQYLADLIDRRKLKEILLNTK
ncbi:hypothetical protein KY342_03315, partial [Candidatus Woesearchaeota archaeon]|nr:hypothetical protein [Candidatus Woesearchaeota archaeon]